MLVTMLISCADYYPEVVQIIPKLNDAQINKYNDIIDLMDECRSQFSGDLNSTITITEFKDFINDEDSGYTNEECEDILFNVDRMMSYFPKAERFPYLSRFENIEIFDESQVLPSIKDGSFLRNDE